ncbi:MAG: type II toxin-antitoxin system VapC family toxin [Spirochaetes bacterium]|nr:MAG: type II toxin-antitoxin system VapC family toxin [Spirochaetota bacterium]RKX85241.1 MAG: type II toxin-antitoxin system VapC family toxin [Spirochaetota bacterium]RKX91205.1 MAG: type II toxin-antitoxin system VapC family toxin [Spirochaetota bacterium]
MIFDTDILIWIQRGNEKAARVIDHEKDRYISIQTYMELLQCAQNKQQHIRTRQFLKDFGFHTLPFTENIGHRAAVYVEEHSLLSDMRAGDAIIAATAAENNLMLCTGNAKHFRIIKDLQLKIFKP